MLPDPSLSYPKAKSKQVERDEEREAGRESVEQNLNPLSGGRAVLSF